MTVVRDPRPRPQELVYAARAALGLEPLDLLVRGCLVVDVWSRTIRRADVGVRGRLIACVGDCGEARRTVEAGGLYLVPGLIDAHVHLESSLLRPAEFARQLLAHGTTSAFIDVHEVANVAGLAGVKAVATELEGTQLKAFVLAPPNVPPSRRVDDGGGASVGYAEALEAARGLSGLGEFMDVHSVAEGDGEAMSFLAEASVQVPVQGHMAGLSGRALDAYVDLGPRDDHEVTSEAEAFERLSRGVRPLVRYGSAWRDLDVLFGVVSAFSPLVPIVADDLHALHLVREGHMDRAVRRAVELGVDPVDAVRAVTLAPALATGIAAWYGAVAPGRFADLVVVDDLRGFRVLRTFVDGREVEGGALKAAEALEGLRGTVRLAVRPRLSLAAPVEEGRVMTRVIELVGSTLTREVVDQLEVRGWRPAIKGDLSEVHVVNRYGAPRQGDGVLGQAIEGAVASSFSHDTHNLVVVGTDRASMASALDFVASRGGGVAVASGGSVVAGLPLPIAGLMTDLPAEEAAEGLGSVTSALSRACRCDGDSLLARLQLITLTVIPELRVTDRGLYSVARRAYVPLMEVG